MSQPQVRSAEAGRILPHVRVPQRFARGEYRGVHAAGGDEAGGNLPPDARARSRTPASPSRLAGTDVALGRADEAGPTGVDRPAPDGGGHLERGSEIPADERWLLPGAGLRAHQASRQADGQDRRSEHYGLPARIAERPEPVARRAWPVHEG